MGWIADDLDVEVVGDLIVIDEMEGKEGGWRERG